MAASLSASHKPVGTEGQTVTHYGLTFGADRGLQLLASPQTWQKFYSGVHSWKLPGTYSYEVGDCEKQKVL